MRITRRSTKALCCVSVTNELLPPVRGSGTPSSQNIWKARCVAQWNVPATTSSAWRALHIDLVHCLSVIDGTARESCGGDYDNVIAIVDVLDRYRSLAEMTRACFDRLGQLLNGDEARDAVKAVDWRIMDHALWALKAYPDDVDLLLVGGGRTITVLLI